MSDDRILRTLRAQAWERAKGELQAVLQTYWADDRNFGPLQLAVNAFIKEVENNGYQE